MEFHKDMRMHSEIRLPSMQSTMKSPDPRGTRKPNFNRRSKENLFKYKDIKFSAEN